MHFPPECQNYHVVVSFTEKKCVISLHYMTDILGHLLLHSRYFDRPKTEFLQDKHSSTAEPQPLPQSLPAAPSVPPVIQIPRNKPPTEQPRQPFRQQPPPMKVLNQIYADFFNPLPHNANISSP